jgi:hypothetical protein
MKFMLLIYHDEAIWDALTETERQEIYGQYRELIQKLEPKGTYLLATSYSRPRQPTPFVFERANR